MRQLKRVMSGRSCHNNTGAGDQYVYPPSLQDFFFGIARNGQVKRQAGSRDEHCQRIDRLVSATRKCRKQWGSRGTSCAVGLHSQSSCYRATKASASFVRHGQLARTVPCVRQTRNHGRPIRKKDGRNSQKPPAKTPSSSFHCRRKRSRWQTEIPARASITRQMPETLARHPWKSSARTLIS